MKQAHWNVKGPHFIGLHELFDQIDEAVESYVDLIAERIVQLGGIAEGTARSAAARSRLEEYPLAIADGHAHVKRLPRRCRHPADVPIYHEWIGTLDGLVNATIRAQVTGYLMTQDYREGDAIKKGDLLFQIDPRPFQAVLDQANGQLAQAEARLGKTELDVKRYAPLVKDKPSARRNTTTPSRPIWKPRPRFCRPRPKWSRPS
jgi:DNA-binding ferritin-like protein